ncbi:MAG: NUDIX domain-containing protein [Polyangiaceae bacterium]
MAKSAPTRPARRGERSFLDGYEASRWPRPSVTVDVVIFTVVDADLKVLLVRRGEHPFRGKLALPGGFLRVGPSAEDQGEDLDDAAARELAEETGLPRGSVFLEQIGAFGAAGRDPRTRVVTVAYSALVRPTLAPLVRAGGDARSAGWTSVRSVDRKELAFDHGILLDGALARLRSQLESTPAVFELVPETFSIPELRAVFEVVRGTTLDAGNFRKRVARLVEDGILELAPGKRVTPRKPARVYRFVRAPLPTPDGVPTSRTTPKATRDKGKTRK